MKLEDAIAVGKSKSEMAINNRVIKSFEKPLTKNGIRQVFNMACRKNEYPEGFMTQKTNDMLGGFIKIFTRSGVEAVDVYTFISDYVNMFKEFAGKELVTGKGDKWAIGNSPNIADLIVCRNEIWAELYKIKVENSQCTQVHKTEYSQEVFDFEYEEAMGKL